jgi:hypothetical protein
VYKKYEVWPKVSRRKWRMYVLQGEQGLNNDVLETHREQVFLCVVFYVLVYWRSIAAFIPN